MINIFFVNEDCTGKVLAKPSFNITRDRCFNVKKGHCCSNDASGSITNWFLLIELYFFSYPKLFFLFA